MENTGDTTTYQANLHHEHIQSLTVKNDISHEWSGLNVKVVLRRDRTGTGETEEGAWFKLLAEHGRGGEDWRGGRCGFMFGTMAMGGGYQAQLQTSLDE